MKVPLVLMKPAESRDRDGPLFPLMVRQVSVVGDAWKVQNSNSFVGARLDLTSRLDFFILDIDPLGD